MPGIILLPSFCIPLTAWARPSKSALYRSPVTLPSLCLWDLERWHSFLAERMSLGYSIIWMSVRKYSESLLFNAFYKTTILVTTALAKGLSKLNVVFHHKKFLIVQAVEEPWIWKSLISQALTGSKYELFPNQLHIDLWTPCILPRGLVFNA